MRVHQVHVQRAYHFAQVLVLQVRQLLFQARRGMVVHQGNGAGHDILAQLLPVLHQLLIDHLGNGLRTAFETARHHHAVQLPEQVLGQRHADAADDLSRDRTHAQNRWL